MGAQARRCGQTSPDLPARAGQARLRSLAPQCMEQARVPLEVEEGVAVAGVDDQLTARVVLIQNPSPHPISLPQAWTSLRKNLRPILRNLLLTRYHPRRLVNRQLACHLSSLIERNPDEEVLNGKVRVKGRVCL